MENKSIRFVIFPFHRLKTVGGRWKNLFAARFANLLEEVW